MRGGDLIAEYLVRENVPYVFGLCGHGIVGLMDALGQRADRIKMIGVHPSSRSPGTCPRRSSTAAPFRRRTAITRRTFPP